jgi:DNA-binding NarL/FixJ family response regulator
MLHHRTFGRRLDTLTIAVIDNRRPILSLMRAMLATIGTGRIETYESPTEAIDVAKVPDIVIAAASMQPVTGPVLVKSMRRASAGPLSLVPTMIMSVRAKPALVEQSLRAGASGARAADHREQALPPARLADQRRLPLRAQRQALCAGGNGRKTVAQLSAPRLYPHATESLVSGRRAKA